jgi:outer membrane receptor for ferrienterochelin and colicin
MHLLNHRLGRITALIALGGAALYSQGTQTANVTGTVVDAAGAPVAGVTVRLTSPALQGVRTYVTDASGKFIARLLPPGFYTIQYSKDGLESRKITEQLGIDQTFSPKVTMSKVGGAVVEVVAAAPAVDKTDVKTATNYRMDSVDQLPTANRSMETVALLTPGVTTGVGGRVQIRGAMTSGNLYLLDGQNVADNAYNNRGVSVIDDSIEETQVVTGAMSAEYGDVEGGVINSITRSGGNEFSGSLRWELNNPSWNALQPFQDKKALNNILGEQKTLFLSGPILKDRLWFAASYFTTELNTPGTIGGDLSNTSVAPGAKNPTNNTGFGAGYVQGRKDIRRQAKLTWSITQDHTLVVAYMRNAINDTNRNYGSGEIASLVPQISVSDFWNATLRSAWATNFTTELRFGKKHQNLSAGGSANGQSPIASDDFPSFFYYNNGIFNNTDGGDNRDNRTYNLKASLFWNGLGSHQTDFGIDYYEGVRRARNEQSPTNMIFEAAGVDLTTRTAIPTAAWLFVSTPGEAKNYAYGLYVNDKWNLDQHWNFQLGLRWDKYKAENESGARTAGADGLSPRLGVTYDLFGDSKHIFKASYARYNAKVLEGITNSVTGQGNPTEVDWYSKSFLAAGGDWLAANRVSFAEIQNLANYAIGAGNPIAYYNNPTLNVKLNDKMKAPTVDEFQGSYAYSFNWEGVGEGYIKVTGVYKNWKNLIDVTTGNNGQVADPTGALIYMNIWDNNPDAKRKYKGLEVEGQFNRNGWTYGGNVTWSKLQGNYEGEGTNTPGRGESINSWYIQNGTQYFDKNWIHPYGYLFGHDPLRMRLNASKAFNNEFGKTTVGFIYRFDSGSHYSNVRSISRARLGSSALSSQAGSSFSQYMDQERGAGVYNGSSFLDLSISHDFPLFKVAGKDVVAFGKVVITNVFNHQQIITFNTAWNSVPASIGGVPVTYPTAVYAPWVQNAQFGQALNSNGYYGQARNIVASAGFRF